MGSLNSSGAKQQSRLQKGFTRFKGQIFLQAMVLPALIWLIVFCYLPMVGIVIAFQDYKIVNGFFGSEWVGLQWFREFLADPYAWEAIGNTLVISLLKLIIGFPAPIIFALLLNEIRSLKFKKVVQTVSYLPFFLSWVVVISIIRFLISADGPLNAMLIGMGILDEPVTFITQLAAFRPIAVLSDLWKGIGWSSIIYIAAISSIPQDMYESAIIDGASRFKRAWHVTLPSILPTIVLLLIMSVAGILGSNMEQHLLLKNPQNVFHSETIDTYVFRLGIQLGRNSFATAVNLSRSVIAFFLLFGADKLSRIFTKGEHGLF